MAAHSHQDERRRCHRACARVISAEAANRLPHPQVSKEFPGRIDTSTPYVIGKVVSRLEMDSRWALARSVRALVRNVIC